MKTKTGYLPIFFLVLVTLWLRLANLGYSDYQGDEVKALYLPSSGQGLAGFLLQQRRGPTQYLITYLIKLFDPLYANQFLARLPFAIAGLISIFFFYQFLKLCYGQKIALYASLFLTLNGLFIGLMRIVQYQPFVLLFSTLALYAYSLAQHRDSWKVAGIYLGTLSWTAAILTHVDGLFIAPFVLYLLYGWYTSKSDLAARTRWSHLATVAIAAVILLAVYYVPLLSAASGDTRAYWASRLLGESEDVFPGSSLFTFTLYNPTLVVYIYFVLGILSLIKIKQNFPVWLWFLFPWLLYELLVYDAGTHIYTYLMPVTILLAFGLRAVEGALRRLLGRRVGNALTVAGLALLFGFLFLLSHFLFVDHTPEYPWEQRRFLFWTLGQPETDYQLWLFGFPYNRKWEEVGGYVAANQGNGYYATNEKHTIAEFYLPYQFDIDRSGYYIHIHNPQSFKNVQRSKDKLRYWIKNHEPVKVLENEGRVVTEIYLMPEGDIQEIRAAGY